MATNVAAFDGMKKSIIKVQVIEICPRDLNIYLQQRAPRTLDELNKIAEQYSEAENRLLHQKTEFEDTNIKVKIQIIRKSMRKPLIK